MHMMLCCLSSAVFMVWYMCQFNVVEINGDPLTKGMLVGLSQIIGSLFVSKLAHLWPDHIGVIFGFCVITTVSAIM